MGNDLLASTRENRVWALTRAPTGRISSHIYWLKNAPVVYFVMWPASDSTDHQYTDSRGRTTQTHTWLCGGEGAFSSTAFSLRFLRRLKIDDEAPLWPSSSINEVSALRLDEDGMGVGLISLERVNALGVGGGSMGIRRRFVGGGWDEFCLRRGWSKARRLERRTVRSG